MACFLVSATEAVVVTIVTKIVKSKEKEAKTVELNLNDGSLEMVEKIPFSKKLKWLSNLLWGGSILLAFEHIWHGEVVPWFPFLTGASNPEDASEMLYEMATTGVTMAVLITAVWLGMVIVTFTIEKRALKPQLNSK